MSSDEKPISLWLTAEASPPSTMRFQAGRGLLQALQQDGKLTRHHLVSSTGAPRAHEIGEGAEGLFDTARVW